MPLQDANPTPSFGGFGLTLPQPFSFQLADCIVKTAKGQASARPRTPVDTVRIPRVTLPTRQFIVTHAVR